MLSLMKQWLISSVEHHPVASGGGRGAWQGFLDGLVAGVAPLPANEVGQEHDEHQAGQGRAHDDGDQHVVFIQLTLLGWKTEATRRGLTPGTRGRIHFLTSAAALTCAEMISAQAKWLHLHLEGVDE